MVSAKIFTLAALASAVVAHPSHRHFGGWRYGNGRGRTPAVTTAAAAAASSAAALPLTISPVPSSTTDAPVVESTPATSSADEECDALSPDCSLTTTTLMTSTEYVTVTVVPTSDAATTVDPVASTSAAALQSPESSASFSSTTSIVAAEFYAKGGRRSTTLATVTTVAATSAAPVVPSSSTVAPVQVSSTTAAASTAPAATSSYTGSSGSKKGLAYNDASLLKVFSNSGWAYNWNMVPSGSMPSGMEYVPMMWGQKFASNWAANAKAAIASGSKHLLSFNEPDHTEQANLSPAAAAQLHIQQMNPFSGQAAIGSPAVTNGGGSMGLTWLQNWFDACGGQCKVDFVAFHWYDSATNFGYFQNHLNDVITLAKKNGVQKVWLTEFGASGSDAQISSFITQATSLMNSNSAVDRYSYFMCSNGMLVNGNAPSTIGQAYASA